MSKKLGITGTVGSGKSLALEIVCELGAEGIQADQVGHALLEDPTVRAEVVALLGDSVLSDQGALDRKKIGAIVFADEQVRERYNALIHPRLLDRLRAWLNTDSDGVRAVEAALIPEWGIETWFDEVWCIRSSDPVALERWNKDPETFWKIRKAQLAPHRKQAKADKVIDNERSQEEFRRRVEAAFRKFQGRNARPGA